MAEHDIVIGELIGTSSRWNFHYMEINRLLDRYLQDSRSLMTFENKTDSIESHRIESKVFIKQLNTLSIQRDHLMPNSLNEEHDTVQRSRISNEKSIGEYLPIQSNILTPSSMNPGKSKPLLKVGSPNNRQLDSPKRVKFQADRTEIVKDNPKPFAFSIISKENENNIKKASNKVESFIHIKNQTEINFKSPIKATELENRALITPSKENQINPNSIDWQPRLSSSNKKLKILDLDTLNQQYDYIRSKAMQHPLSSPNKSLDESTQEISHQPSPLKTTHLETKPTLSVSRGIFEMDAKTESLPDLIEENINQIERKLLLQKRAEEEEKGEEPRHHSSIFISNEELLQEAKLLSTNQPIKLADSQNIHERLQKSPNRLQSATKETENNSTPSRKKSPFKERKTYEQVVEEYEDGTRYEGEKYLEKRHGKGTFHYLEGYRYEGDWEDDMMTGFGTLWFDSTRKLYEGEFQRGLFHGKGTAYNNQAQPEALGSFDGSDFSSLRGGWKKFEGQYRAGKKNGFGSLFMLNGDLFVGKFLDDAVEDQGSYTFKDGRIRMGIWKNNLLVKEF